MLNTVLNTVLISVPKCEVDLGLRIELGKKREITQHRKKWLCLEKRQEEVVVVCALPLSPHLKFFSTLQQAFERAETSHQLISFLSLRLRLFQHSHNPAE